MTKKYSNVPAKSALSVKEQTQTSEIAVRFATPEMMEKAISQVVKIHGTALQKLAK